VGNNYQTNQINPATGSPYGPLPFIIPSAHAQGGEILEESGAFLCPNAAVTNTSSCVFNVPYSVLSWKTGLHSVKNGNLANHLPAHFALNRKDAFHYVFFGHALGIVNPATPKRPKSTSGAADRPGGDVLITMGLWRSDSPADDQTGSALQQAGTLMHELGHNLNLSHAGLYRMPNCMPNYLSVMNYQYQVRGLTGIVDRVPHIDFSSGSLVPFSENSLSEAVGFLGNSPYRVRFYGPAPAGDPGAATRFCDGSPFSGSVPSMMRLESPGPGIDWNNNGAVDAASYSQDVNFDGTLGDGRRRKPVLRRFERLGQSRSATNRYAP